jgi:hypothetical protein
MTILVAADITQVLQAGLSGDASLIAAKLLKERHPL